MTNTIGGSFKVIDDKKYKLPGPFGPTKFEHICTISDGLREYIHFLDTSTFVGYIEEITGGHLSRIDDDELWMALGDFIQEQGYNTIDSTKE